MVWRTWMSHYTADRGIRIMTLLLFLHNQVPLKIGQITMAQPQYMEIACSPYKSILSENENNEIQCPPCGSSRPVSTNAENSNIKERLACPYYKHNPKQFRRLRTCAGPGFNGIHRLKEHLYRKHGCPRHTCSRCLHDFKTPARLSEHMRALQACVVAPNQKFDGQMTADQQLLLRSRRMSKNSTDEGKWNDIYRILFPNANPTNIPSPYFETEEESLILAENRGVSPGVTLNAAPDPALERSVKTELWRVLCSSEEDYNKVEKIYEIVRKFPKDLLKQGQPSYGRGALGESGGTILEY
ncbi:hypothetical protein F4805DRAFT_303968 [Annulohypoxylon moriforme]|nr:hypothetical protein F4805DRAFT_303968 [Annulohypoxylon moriforme]